MRHRINAFSIEATECRVHYYIYILAANYQTIYIYIYSVDAKEERILLWEAEDDVG